MLGTGDCDRGHDCEYISRHLQDILLSFGALTFELLLFIEFRSEHPLSPSEAKQRLSTSLEACERNIGELKRASSNLPDKLATVVARFWNAFDWAKLLVSEASCAVSLDHSSLMPAFLDFGTEVTLWMSLLASAQIEEGFCNPPGSAPLSIGFGMVAPGAGRSRAEVLLNLVRFATADHDDLLIGPLRMVEVGTRTGLLAEALLSAEARLELIVVDPWEHAPQAYQNNLKEQQENDFGPDVSAESAWKRLTPFRPRVHFITSTSISASYWVANASLDLVFIDADHSYEATKADLVAWAPKVKASGILSGHDYNSDFPGVVRAVREFVKASASNGLATPKIWLGADSMWWTVR